MGYAPAMWGSFGGALAAVSGALTGLLFVALSVKGEVLTASRSLASRAAQTLVLFMTSVLTAILLVVPQPSAALGAELLTLAVASGAVLLVLDRRAGHDASQGVVRSIEKFSPNTITAVLIGIAAITLLVKAGGGLYWLPRHRGQPGRRRRQRVAVPRPPGRLRREQALRIPPIRGFPLSGRRRARHGSFRRRTRCPRDRP
jgi:hypothetical protein